MTTKSVSFKSGFLKDKAVSFTAKKKVWTGQLPGEDYLTALVRCFYPRVHRRHLKMKAAKVAA